MHVDLGIKMTEKIQNRLKAWDHFLNLVDAGNKEAAALLAAEVDVGRDEPVAVGDLLPTGEKNQFLPMWMPTQVENLKAGISHLLRPSESRRLFGLLLALEEPEMRGSEREQALTIARCLPRIAYDMAETRNLLTQEQWSKLGLSPQFPTRT